MDGRDRLGFPSGESSDGTSQGASLESAHQNYSPNYTPKGEREVPAICDSAWAWSTPRATDEARMIRNITRRRAKLLKTILDINFSRLGFYEKPPQFARI